MLQIKTNELLFECEENKSLKLKLGQVEKLAETYHKKLL